MSGIIRYLVRAKVGVENYTTSPMKKNFFFASKSSNTRHPIINVKYMMGQ